MPYRFANQFKQLRERAEKAEAHADALAEALREIANGPNGPMSQWAVQLAREALDKLGEDK